MAGSPRGRGVTSFLLPGGLVTESPGSPHSTVHSLNCESARPRCHANCPRAACPPKMLICWPLPCPNPSPGPHGQGTRMWRGGGPRDSCAAWFLRRPSPHTSCSHRGLFLPFMPLPELLCLPGGPSSPLPAPVPTCGPLGSYVQTQSGTSSFPEDALPGPGTLEPLLLTPLLWSLHPSCPPAPKADTSQSPGDIW